MIFNECGEIVTIENRYKSIDQWLNESYLIDEYLNEGKISAGIEKAIRWLIDGFMHIVDILKNISNSKAIKYIKQHRKEILDKIINDIPLHYSSLGDWTVILGDFKVLNNINFKKFDEMCKNPTMYQDMSSEEIEKEIFPLGSGSSVEKQDMPVIITNALDAIINNTKLSNDIRRSIRSLKVLSKETDVDRQFVHEIVRVGKYAINCMHSAIKSCLSFIKKAMNGEFDKDWKYKKEKYGEEAAREQEWEREQEENKKAFQRDLKSRHEEFNKEVAKAASSLKDLADKNSEFADEINEILNGI